MVDILKQKRNERYRAVHREEENAKAKERMRALRSKQEKIPPKPRTKSEFNQPVHDNSVMQQIRKGKDKKLKAAFDTWMFELRQDEASFNKWHTELWKNNHPEQARW
jgi:hypothetical protein